MKLKKSVTNKLSKMSKEELLGLINDLCDSNDEVVSYLNKVNPCVCKVFFIFIINIYEE